MDDTVCVERAPYDAVTASVVIYQDTCIVYALPSQKAMETTGLNLPCIIMETKTKSVTLNDVKRTSQVGVSPGRNVHVVGQAGGLRS